MDLQVSKWGNSLAVRLPVGLVKQLNVTEGSILQGEVLGPQLLGISSKAKLQSRRALAEELRAMHARMPVTTPVSRAELSRY